MKHCIVCEDYMAELYAQADLLGMESLTEDQQLAVEKGCCCGLVS